MKIPLFALLLAGTVTLTGCTIESFPDAGVIDPPTLTKMPPIQGSVFGGHAALVGAHVYLVQPGISGYGSLVTSLLTSTPATSGSYSTTQNGHWTNSGANATDQFVPTSFYGEQTDSLGQFNLSGDYTCVANQPVIIIAVGGAPSFIGQGTGTTTAPGAQSNVFNLTSVVVSGATGTGSGTGTATYTFNVATGPAELYYPGESITFAGLPTANQNGSSQSLGSFFNGGSFTVSATNLSTTSFQITTNVDIGQSASPTTPVFPNGTYATTGTTTGAPPFNSAAVNMAVLGNCPSAAPYNFGSSSSNPVSYVYMNEVSTTATAYSFAGFENTAATNLTGNDEFHIGSPNTTQALKGIANAAVTARKIYDITGSQQTTSFAGEGHIANSVTPIGLTGAATVGTVPQAMVDTIANIFAACVDSNNTYYRTTPGTAGTGTISAACGSLERTAQENGVIDGNDDTTLGITHVPFNIAQAAFNMARFPSGAGAGTTNTTTGVTTVSADNATTATGSSGYVTTLYNIPTGNVPFTPNLTSTGTGKPNDFSIIIQYTAQTNGNCPAGTRCTFEGMDIDKDGNIYDVSPNILSSLVTGGVFELNVDGSTNEYLSPPTGGSIANFTDVLTTQPQRSTLTQIGINTNTPAELFVSAQGVGAGSQGTFVWNIGTQQPVATYSVGVDGNGTGLVVDETEFIEANQGVNFTSRINKTYSNTTQATAPFPIVGSGTAAANTPTACVYEAAFLAEDNAKNLWTDSFNLNAATPGNSICEFDTNGNLIYSFFLQTYTGAGTAAQPTEMAIDRNSNLFYADANFTYLGRINASQGTVASPKVATAPSVVATGGTISSPRGVAIDGLNSVWMLNGDSGTGATAPRGSLVHYANGASAVTNITPTYLQGTGTFTYIDPRTNTSDTILDLNYVRVDPSGNVWAGGDNQGQLFEWVGAGAPTVTPLALARFNNTIGIKP